MNNKTQNSKTVAKIADSAIIAAKALQQGIALHQSGRLDAAIASYQTALAIAPENTTTIVNIGSALQAQSKLDAAISYYQKALALQPTLADAHYNLGVTLNHQGKLTQAASCYQQAITLRPDFADAHFNLAQIQKAQGKPGPAITSLQKAIAIQPAVAKFHLSLAMLLKEQGNHDAAVVSFFQAIKLQPDLAEAYNNLGIVLTHQGKLPAAITNLKQAIALQPAYAEAYSNLGNAFTDQNNLPAAVASYKKAIALEPDFAKAHHNLAVAQKIQGDLAAAIASLQQAVLIQADFPAAQSNLLLCAQYVPGQTMENLLAMHQKAAAAIFPSSIIETFCHKDRPSPIRPLRIGLVSADFGRHPIGYFMAGFFKQHQATAIAIICYSNHLPDDLTKELRANADEWVDTHDLDDAVLAQRIYNDQIDILIDLGGHTAKNRLLTFASRPAPIQISWAGYVGTTGVPTMDWLIADRHYVAAGEEKFYTEQIFRMPDAYVCYAPPDYLPDTVPWSPTLDDERCILGSFANVAKINAEMLEVWAGILQQCPQADLLLIYPGMDEPGNLYRINDFFAKAGIAADRVEIEGYIPHRQLLARYNHITLALDTLPYSGGLTTLEALSMGVPVVTTCGATFAGRHSASYLRTLGLDELVTDSLEEYARLVVTLVNNPRQLKKYRTGLRERLLTSPLCDHKKFARDFQLAIKKIWQEWSLQQKRQNATKPDKAPSGRK